MSGIFFLRGEGEILQKAYKIGASLTDCPDLVYNKTVYFWR